MAPVDAVSVSPTSALPVMAGSPVAGLLSPSASCRLVAGVSVTKQKRSAVSDQVLHPSGLKRALTRTDSVELL